MSLQFVFDVNKAKFAKSQRLPSLFTKSFYNGTPWLYLIHNRGTKHKVWIKQKSENHYKLYGDEWAKFVEDNRYTNVGMLHFIKEEEDTYYVTTYNHAGVECGGYDSREIGSRQMRCLVFQGQNLGRSPLLPGDFLQDIVTNEYEIRMGGMNLATVNHRRVYIRGTDHPKIYANLFHGDGWNTVVESQHLVPGKPMVFTKLGGAVINMITFGRDGLGLGFEDIPRTELDLAFPICRGPLDKDPRMFHICDWEGHDQHRNEDACFYTPMLAYVIDRTRLTVPAKYVEKSELYTFDNAIVHHGGMEFPVDLEVIRHKKTPKRKVRKNHLTMVAKDKWKHINRQCHFRKNKMIRFQLVDVMTDLVETVDAEFPVLVPIFDMC